MLLSVVLGFHVCSCLLLAVFVLVAKWFYSQVNYLSMVMCRTSCDNSVCVKM